VRPPDHGIGNLAHQVATEVRRLQVQFQSELTQQVQRRAHAPWTSSTTTPHCLQLTRQHAIDQKDQIAPESDKLKSPRRGRLVVARRRSMTAGANGAGSFPWPHRVRTAGSSSAKGARP